MLNLLSNHVLGWVCPALKGDYLCTGTYKKSAIELALFVDQLYPFSLSSRSQIYTFHIPKRWISNSLLFDEDLRSINKLSYYTFTLPSNLSLAKKKHILLLHAHHAYCINSNTLQSSFTDEDLYPATYTQEINAQQINDHTFIYQIARRYDNLQVEEMILDLRCHLTN